MRHAKKILLALAVSVVCDFFTGDTRAVAPATRPAKILLSKLPFSVKQELNAVNDPAYTTPLKVIDFSQPREYAEWFRQRFNSSALDECKLLEKA